MSQSLSPSSQIIPNFVIFKTPTGKINVEVYFQDGTLRLTQKKMSELFEVNVPAVSKHLKNIFDTWELIENSVISILETTANDGKIYKTKYYNLQAILAVWYRINSSRAIEFRKRATTILEEYIIKWYAMDDVRLKEINHFGEDYFDEMLERIREIRLSERRLYQKITDIYSLSADYDTQSEITKHFFASVQNKLHRAITGKTAAEIIYTKADANKTHMWLKTRKQSPHGKILKSDVSIAKNYLDLEHIDGLNRIVTSYLDLAESRAKNKQIMNMRDRDIYLQQFLELWWNEILQDQWSISMLEAKLKAESEYDHYRIIQDKLFQSDFDQFIQNLQE